MGPGPYLREGGWFWVQPPPVGPIMLILTLYFNDNLRLTPPQPPNNLPRNPPPNKNPEYGPAWAYR